MCPPVKETKFRLQVVFRAPKCPAIIIFKDGLLAGMTLKSLAEVLAESDREESEHHVRVIDSAGAEFWYIPERAILAPGFTFKKWSKKRIIELFNSSPNCRRLGAPYCPRSLANRTLAVIVADVVKLLCS